MAGTNRNRKLWLSEAWKHYWSVLFPDGIDWRTDLEDEIRNRLYFAGETNGFPSGLDPDLRSPLWAGDLDLDIQGNLVTARFQEAGLGAVPLFANSPFQAVANWKHKNPFDGIDDRIAAKGRDRENCRGFLIAAVRDCGSSVQNHLLRMLKETEQPKFEIYGRPSGDALGEEKRIPEFALSEISRIDIPQNALAGRLGVPMYSYVQIKQRKPSHSKAGRHGSYREQDAALVEEMKQLIDRGEVPNVRQAAMVVQKQAPRRVTSSDESVIRRLQKRFFEEHPDYTNRRGRKGSPLS